MPEELVVMCSGAFSGVLRKSLPAFQLQTGLEVEVIQGPSIGASPRALPVRLRSGESADLVILFDDALGALLNEGLVLPDTSVRVALSGIGAATQRGSIKRELHTIDTLRATILAVNSFAYSSSASGLYVSNELLQRLELPPEIARKGRRVENEPVGKVVARGEAELGFQQMSELLPIEGLEVLGPLPDEVQRFTLLSAALPTKVQNERGSRALIKYLLSDEARTIILAGGLRPEHVR